MQAEIRLFDELVHYGFIPLSDFEEYGKNTIVLDNEFNTDVTLSRYLTLYSLNIKNELGFSRIFFDRVFYSNPALNVMRLTFYLKDEDVLRLDRQIF